MKTERQNIASNITILLETAHRFKPSSGVKTGLDLFSKAQNLASRKDLDIIATECLFIASLDNNRILSKAYQDAHRQSCSPNTAVINSKNPAEALRQKLSDMEKAAAYKCKPEAEIAIRKLVNKARKTFPSIILKVEIDNGILAITTRIRSHSAPSNIKFGKANLNDLGRLIIKAEKSLLDWCEHQALRLQMGEVFIMQVVNEKPTQKHPYKRRKKH